MTQHGRIAYIQADPRQSASRLFQCCLNERLAYVPNDPQYLKASTMKDPGALSDGWRRSGFASFGMCSLGPGLDIRKNLINLFLCATFDLPDLHLASIMDRFEDSVQTHLIHQSVRSWLLLQNLE
jgi:hypothetical protein